MRRLLLDSDKMNSHYHVMTRCVNGEALLDEPSREVLRKMIWKIADFCNVEVITYAILPNHFHILLHIPQRTSVSDAELLRRYQLLHPHYSPYMPARIEVIADWLKRDTSQAGAFRQQQFALMFDLSSFMKLLKQRFTMWFNATYNRFGTLWAERFKSVLVDYEGYTLRTIAAYIDLNAVRKGLVVDPKDYRFCGYAEALAGSRSARAGLCQITGESSWARSQSLYRLLLYSTGSAPRAKGHCMDTAAFEAVMDADGNIPIPDLLRHKWRYFTNGTILGSPAFVARYRPLLAFAATPPSHSSKSSPPPDSHSITTMPDSDNLSHVSDLLAPKQEAAGPCHLGPWGDAVTARRVYQDRKRHSP